MKEEELLDLYRRYEFNKTAGETLVRLVGDAIEKGERVRATSRELKSLAARLATELVERGLIFGADRLPEKGSHTRAVGIDGGFAPIGGAGGTWYVPYSVARVIFESGMMSQPTVDIEAGIAEVQEPQALAIGLESALVSMTGETKALKQWGSRCLPSVVFIDGPIADPPSYRDRLWVETRCDAVKLALKSCLVIGCVKRSREEFFKAYLTKLPSTNPGTLTRFPSDQHLLLYAFLALRETGRVGPLFTTPIDISDQGIHAQYHDHGVSMACSFVQATPTSRVLRLDIPSLVSNTADPDRNLEAVREVLDWILPGHELPLPIHIADEKCRIRDGCAEVLYDEIMTRSMSSDRFGQLASINLR